MKRRAFGLIILASIGHIFVASDSRANVSLQNGNFFIGYTDLVYSGGYEPKVERVYNSKSPFNSGIFGWGWGSEYEVRLSVSSDGSVVAHEYGGGAENRFVPKTFKRADLVAAVDAIAKVGRESGLVGTATQLAEYKKKLLADAIFRNSQWESFVAQGKLKPRQLAAGTQLISNRFSYQYITKTKDGYVRSFDSGKTESFDTNGKLVKVQDKNGNFVALTYSADGRVQMISDNLNRKMNFKFSSQGLVEEIEGESGKSAKYKYNGQRELVYSKDMDGNVYEYDYTSDSRHNMAKIKYSDKTNLEITYYGRDQKENVKSIKDRDGTFTEYSYLDSKTDKNHYKVSLVVKGKEGNKITSSSYEYFYKEKPTGETWTYRMIADLDGERTDTIYNECCGLPLKIQKGKEISKFSYDSKGHVTEKDNPTELTRLAYHPKFGKVTRVQTLSKGTKKSSWSEFTYDAKGNLAYAKNSQKKGVRLVYDRLGRIASMVDQSKRVITFKYNENSKPIEIADPKLGAITVEYANTGEIKKVDSSAGRKIAMQVTSAFQNLLEIIRPAGVTLSL